MNKRIRYGIIAAGFIFFCVAAPLLILYVRGLSYDGATGQLISTGIIAVRVSPADAAVWINGVERRTSQGDVRFVAPGEYDIEVKKDGYRPWHKRLAVSAEHVTWANPVPLELQLVRETAEPQLVHSGARAAALLPDGTVAALATGSVTFIEPENPDRSETVPLAEPGNRIAPLGSGALVSSNGRPSAVVAPGQPAVNLSAVFKGSGSVFTGSGGRLYGVSASSLWSITASGTPSLLVPGVDAAAATAGTLYYVRASGTSRVLAVLPETGGTEQVLATSVPPGELTVTVSPRRQVFLGAGGALHRVGSDLERLAVGVTDLRLSAAGGFLTYVHGGEVSLLDLETGAPQLVTRTTEPLGGAAASEQLRYTVVVRGGSVVAVELDPRNEQNEYVLYRGGKPELLGLSKNGRDAFVLDGGNVYRLNVR